MTQVSVQTLCRLYRANDKVGKEFVIERDLARERRSGREARIANERRRQKNVLTVPRVLLCLSDVGDWATR